LPVASEGEIAMMGELSAAEIDEVLRSEVLGRIGYIADGWPCVLPVNYVYDGESVYVHSPEGAKVRAMRGDPRVCFEVEQIRSLSNWRTVVARGRFEELFHDDRDRAMKVIAARLARIGTSASARLVEQEDVYRREEFRRPVLFRISLQERTGRFELV
jgi:nitroimidazol reductase NimA-like FMN-containing flavoprotein (pyridoxamine 5'-phosphate oxidase superfamily)